MTKYHKTKIPVALGAMLALSVAVAACGGGTVSGPTLPAGPTATPGGGGAPAPTSPATTTPTTRPTGNPTSGPTARPTATPTAPPTKEPTPSPTATPTIAPQACNAAGAPIPGTYTSVLMPGNVNGSTFTLAAGAIWLRSMYTLATPAPSPSPTTLPTISPPPVQPLYVYSGTYTVKHSDGIQEPTGCAVLVTTQSGKPLTNLNYNATAAGNPNFKEPVNSTFVGTGAVTSVSLTNLTASGGSGTFALSDGSTGTLNLGSRMSVASFIVRR